ncbi:LysR family transcriptional regulator [Burkholderia anthina]|uniref:LysR family transcriptional regulator n=1 Tax=Burkholderia anthina TaxID=179879 RepID=A0A6P2G670_9BURK|nr:LysR family transcriptional regulator [Burkholderia anthina]MBM2767547.1 LysR family transcriptional regulator [Burkholderia anthina]VVU49178.1 LysR family transcriptional regulator [Burkholderia anthina]
MKTIVPPLSQLLAFEAVARTLSFTVAAQELSVTQGAISRQISDLEESLGVLLFYRTTRRLAITLDGERYVSIVRSALQDLTDATKSLKEGGGQEVRVAVATAFAIHWIYPRFASLKSQHPNLKVQLLHYLGEASALENCVQAHCAIYLGNGSWEKQMADYLGGDDFVIACSPEYWVSRLVDPKHLPRCDLLHHQFVQDIWMHVFRALDLSYELPSNRVCLESFALLEQAAIAGQGVVAAPVEVLTQSLKAGVLVNVLGYEIKLPIGYYLIYSESFLRHLPFSIFRNWLLSIRASADS